MSENRPESPRRESDRVFMQLPRGRGKNLKVISVELIDAPKGSPHPFKAINRESGNDVPLGQGELVQAYQTYDPDMPVPENILKGLRTSSIIAESKEKKPPKLATDEEALETLVRDN